MRFFFKKKINSFTIYINSDNEGVEVLPRSLSIGDNKIRKKIQKVIRLKGKK